MCKVRDIDTALSFLPAHEYMDEVSREEDELIAEYHFDYQKAKQNRFAPLSGTQRLNVVVLDEDVAQVFKTPESVNKVLRSLIESVPQVADSEP